MSTKFTDTHELWIIDTHNEALSYEPTIEWKNFIFWFGDGLALVEMSEDEEREKVLATIEVDAGVLEYSDVRKFVEMNCQIFNIPQPPAVFVYACWLAKRDQ